MWTLVIDRRVFGIGSTQRGHGIVGRKGLILVGRRLVLCGIRLTLWKTVGTVLVTGLQQEVSKSGTLNQR